MKNTYITKITPTNCPELCDGDLNRGEQYLGCWLETPSAYVVAEVTYEDLVMDDAIRVSDAPSAS